MFAIKCAGTIMMQNDLIMCKPLLLKYLESATKYRRNFCPTYDPST